MLVESKEYKKCYQNAIMEVHKQYKLRNRKFPINSSEKVLENTPSTSQTKVDPPKGTPQNQDTFVKEVERSSSSFSLENEISNIKIYVSLLELMKKDTYKGQILKEKKM